MINPDMPKLYKDLAVKIARFFVLSLVFIVLAALVFWGMQWFSHSIGEMFIGKVSFSGSLESVVDNVKAEVNTASSQSLSLSPYRNWQVEDVSLQTQAAISVEIGGGARKVLFHSDEEKKLPIASLTKLMAAKVVLDHYDLSKSVAISEAAMAQEGEQGMLLAGQKLSVNDLLYSMLAESSNRAAYALSELMPPGIFVAIMNENVRMMGLANTHFEDATGLGADSYSTAKELVILTQHLLEHYPLFKKIISQQEHDIYFSDGNFHHKAMTTNELLGVNGVIGGKTGFTKDAQGCMMILQTSQHPGNYVISIVLGAQDRFTQTKKLMEWVDMAYQW